MGGGGERYERERKEAGIHLVRQQLRKSLGQLPVAIARRMIWILVLVFGCWISVLLLLLLLIQFSFHNFSGFFCS